MFNLQFKGNDFRVYEYQDAEALIAGLSEKYQDDLTAISKGGRGRNRKYYYNYCKNYNIYPPRETKYPFNKIN